jgi:fumarylacetoacetate (FAA) hydrolase
MKLASYRDGSRDGQLVVVSRDLGAAHYATGIATRLQQVVDDWGFLSPQLEDLYQSLNHGKARHTFAFDPAQCMAPLPRAYRWVHAWAPHGHDSGADPPMVHAGGDALRGPRDDIVVADEAFGIDVGWGIAAITGDIEMGSGPDAALEGIRLLMLVGDVRLGRWAGAELPSPGFAPVAVTPDELGAAWHGGRAEVHIEATRNRRRAGSATASSDTQRTFHFGALLARIAQTRHVKAGSIVGSGTAGAGAGSMGDHDPDEPGAPEPPCLDFLKFGESLRIEAKGRDGSILFGAIEHKVAPLHHA